jgi:cell wall-associated NlpC family hydrolase
VSRKNAHATLIAPRKQLKYQRDFFKHFFSPWELSKISFAKSAASYRKTQMYNINSYRHNLGYGENYHPNTRAWFNEIVDNMNITSFPNQNRNAIIVHNALLRYMPTLDPHFGSPHIAGQGYPFDNFQKSMLMIGTPIHVYQVAKLGDWVFVQSPAVFGWIQSRDIAYVDINFIKRWNAAHYVATVTKEYPIRDTAGIYRFHAYLGAVFPMAKESARSYTILIPVADINREASILRANVSKKIMQKMPLAPTPTNFARVTNQLLGESYGWGGLFFLTDCSSALKNIYAAFGIWLPRHSGAQVGIGRQVNLSSLSPRGRQDYIIRYGIPFITLIHVTGHIMMYIGSKDGKVMTFQNVWALQTWAKRGFGYCEGRAVVGKAVLIPLELQYDRGMTPQIAVNELDISYL